jgi:hypothetical protein
MGFTNLSIEIVKDFNYLGIYFSRTGSFKVCKNHLSEKAIKAMYEVITGYMNIAIHPFYVSFFCNFF